MEIKKQDKIRINKYLAMSGICSRRDADKLIAEGVVTINGRIAGMGELVGEKDRVLVRKKEARTEKKRVVLAFYKPQGVVCTERDKYAQKKIMDLIRYPIRVTYAGRLDKDSEGLLLLTNDGDLIQAMMKGSGNHEKEYIVKTDKEITNEFIKKMEAGVYLEELAITTKPCKLKKDGKFTFHITLTQGVNRQIRRMCKTFGYEVKHLKRIRVMSILLGNLQEGKFRELQEKELVLLYNQCGLKRQ